MALWVATFFAIQAFGGVVDAKKMRLEDLPLKQSMIPVKVIKLPGEDGDLIEDIDGNRYDLSNLEPYVELFARKHFVSSSDKTTITDTRTGEVMAVPIFKATYDDGSVVLVEKDGDAIKYIELRKPQGEPDMFLVPDLSQQGDYPDANQEVEFLAYTEDDIDYELLQSQFHYAEVDIPEGDADANRMLRSGERATQEDMVAPTYDYREGREFFTSLSLRRCSSYQVVNLAVVFDAEFCEIYGSFAASRRRIMTIVASASFHYERDLCVRLEITDIYTPESSCSATNRPSFFENFDRDFPCGGGNNASFLSLFRRWMRRNRGSLKIDSDATLHMFSGYPPPSGTIGCAWVGAFCSSYSYGIEYMGFSSNPHSQGVVLAHEVGHVLNAPHLATSSFYRHVMEPNINNAADGFSQFSVNRILKFLNSDSITCDGTTESIPTREPSQNPTPRPSPEPTARSVRDPTPPPTPFPTWDPTGAPSPAPDESKCSIYEAPPNEPVCLFASSDNDKYACYEASSLLHARATSPCLFSTPRTRISRCDGPLRTGQIPNEQMNDGELGPPDLFETRSCSAATCVVVSNFVCFRSDDQEQTYTISYIAVADSDVLRTFTTDVLVKMDNGSNDCDVATTTCVSE